MTHTMDDLIEDARKVGYEDLADAMEQMYEIPNPFDLENADLGLSEKRKPYFKIGVYVGRDVERRVENYPEYLGSLRDEGYYRLSDAADYCIFNPEEVSNDDFDTAELPLESEELLYFGFGLSYGIAYVRAEKA